MPKKPLKPCAWVGCPELTGDRYCKEHTRQINKDYDESRRDRASKKIYDSPRWRKLRLVVLKREPMCRMCKTSPATLVDHIKEIRDGGAPFDVDNLQPLCAACHAKKTAAERMGRGGSERK